MAKGTKTKHVHCTCLGICRTFGEAGAAGRARALHYAAERLADAKVQEGLGTAPPPHPYPSITDQCPVGA